MQATRALVKLVGARRFVAGCPFAAGRSIDSSAQIGTDLPVTEVAIRQAALVKVREQRFATVQYPAADRTTSIRAMPASHALIFVFYSFMSTPELYRV
jgi:hypothetical protein